VIFTGSDPVKGWAVGSGPGLACGLAAGDRGDDTNRLAVAELGLDAAPPAHVLAVDVHVDERAQHVVLVEEQVAHRQSAQGGSDRRRLELELLPPTRLVCEQTRQKNGYHSPTSTESTAGRYFAASIQSSPSFGETKTEPLFVPK
jgi:hypothetical protein